MWKVIPIFCFCFALGECQSGSTEYRTFDGTGNNAANPSWGAAETPFRRVLPADYCGAPDQPRCQKDGSPLPSAREISHTLLQTRGNRDPPDSRTLTSLYMAFGQFLAHDPGLSRPATKEVKKICSQKAPRPSAVSGECIPIAVEEGDPVYDPATHPTIPLVRDQREEKQQVNLQTSWLDLSHVYGNSKEAAERLMEDPATSAKLKLRAPPLYTGRCDKKGILPKCQDGSCEFDAGDIRVGEQPGLTAFHTIFAREHNRIVDGLKAAKPDWAAKLLYDEARRINIAQFQHIVYNEYVPALLGSGLPQGATLEPTGSFFTDYDATNDATTSNEFMAASFRFGHSQIQLTLVLASSGYRVKKVIPFEEAFFNTTLVREGKIDDILHGAILQDAEKSDGLFNRMITSKFRTPHGEILGEDLIAIDIQRSRDHGIPGYNAWRRHCNLLPVGFKGKLKKFEEVYTGGDPDDIDLFVGAMKEKQVKGSLVGETFNCLLGQYFTSFRVGDSSWYEREGQFTQKQLTEIRKASLARILCDNMDKMKRVQRRPMEQIKNPHERIPCEEIPVVDLSKMFSEPA